MEAIYDEKVIQILDLLEQGLSREEVAEQFRYASHRSMDEYMRRKNFRWGRQDETYVEANAAGRPIVPQVTLFPSEKVRRIVNEFEKETTNPREIAMKLGFENHFEMSNYMTSKGFEWSNEAVNYVESSTDQNSSDATDCDDATSEVVTSANTNGNQKQYLHLLQWLSENKDAIESVIEASVATGASRQIPRFTLPGLFITKSVHMTNVLDQMIRDFSKEKNINQREIFEVVLIEFMQKYGLRKEVDMLLNPSN